MFAHLGAKQVTVAFACACRSRALGGPHCFSKLTLGTIHKLQLSVVFDLLIFSASPKRCAMQSASPSGRRDYAEHRQIIAGMSQLGRAMAFAARIWDANRGRFLVSLDDAQWYSEHIDAAIEIEQESISRGNMPRRRFTIGYVEELLASSTGPSAERGPEAASGCQPIGAVI